MPVHALSQEKRNLVVINKSINSKFFLFFLFFFPVVISCSSRDEKSMNFIIHGAKNFKEIYSDNRVEYSYSIEEKYPARSAIDKFRFDLSSNGYSECKSAINEWQSFFQGESNAEVEKYNRQIVGVNKKSKSIVFIVLWYDSFYENVLVDLGVSVQFFLAKDHQELIDMLEYMSADCDISPD